MNPQTGQTLNFAMQSLQRNDFVNAERLLKQALKMSPKESEAYRLLAVIYAIQTDFILALKMIDKALLYNQKNGLAHSNKGNILRKLHLPQEALKSYDKAITLDPNYMEVYSNRGNVMCDMRRYDEAIESYDEAIRLHPHYAVAHNGKGNALKKLGHFNLALKSYEAAIQYDGSIDYAYGSYLEVKMNICDWIDLDFHFHEFKEKFIQGKAKAHPFPFLAAYDDPEFNQLLARRYTQSEHPQLLNLGNITTPIKEKIKIGYYSPDLRNHPVAFLTAELFELHDRSKFEIYAFSIGDHPVGEMNLRLKNSFDQFIDITNKNDQEVAELTRIMGIDVAVDLGGLTENSRLGIFSFRAAPIQISYIGYIGTAGADYIDYIIADRVAIPEKYQAFYSEKIIYLPSFQVNDSKRKISEKIFTKEDFGIPSESFAFCCFSNSYKINPKIFDAWCDVLKLVQDSILFLFAANDLVKNNLLVEFEARGLDRKRLIFSEHLPYSEYLARYRVCDLFLDTSPYNAGTTASDALWAGLPVLTLTGETFSARMGASLLTAINLPEMITYSIEEYKNLAVELAMSPKKIQVIKDKLKENRLSTKLFNSIEFTRTIEAAYIEAINLSKNDLMPENIFINEH